MLFIFKNILEKEKLYFFQLFLLEKKRHAQLKTETQLVSEKNSTENEAGQPSEEVIS